MTDRGDVDVKEWLAIREREGLEIDAGTAEATWVYSETLDPYCVYNDLSEEYRAVGREYFARRPGGDIWVWFGDLPKRTRERLWERLNDGSCHAPSPIR